MLRKRILWRTVVGFALLGFAGALIPLLSSWLPNAKSQSTRLRIEVDDLLPGQHRIVRHGLPGEGLSYGWGFLLVRRKTGSIDVWDLLVDRDGAVGMPDFTWRHLGVRCKSFGPSESFAEASESAMILCRDEDLSKFWKRELRWTLDGASLGQHTADLKRTPGKVEGQAFVVGR